MRSPSFMVPFFSCALHAADFVENRAAKHVDWIKSLRGGISGLIASRYRVHKGMVNSFEYFISTEACNNSTRNFKRVTFV